MQYTGTIFISLLCNSLFVFPPYKFSYLFTLSINCKCLGHFFNIGGNVGRIILIWYKYIMDFILRKRLLNKRVVITLFSNVRCTA